MTDYASLDVAKKLKAAGFPQDMEKSHYIDRNSGINDFEDTTDEDGVEFIESYAAPSIGELHKLVSEEDLTEYILDANPVLSPCDCMMINSIKLKYLRSIPLLADVWIWKHGNKKELK